VLLGHLMPDKVKDATALLKRIRPLPSGTVAALAVAWQGRDESVRDCLLELLESRDDVGPTADLVTIGRAKLKGKADLQSFRLLGALAALDGDVRATVPLLVSFIDHPEWGDKAVEVLGRIGPAAKQDTLPHVLNVLKAPLDKNAPTRAAVAARALVRIDSNAGLEKASPDLVAFLRQSDDALVVDALGPSGVPLLIAMLRDRDAKIRLRAASLLGTLGWAAHAGLGDPRQVYQPGGSQAWQTLARIVEVVTAPGLSGEPGIRCRGFRPCISMQRKEFCPLPT
jgi:hypothetical protein